MKTENNSIKEISISAIQLLRFLFCISYTGSLIIIRFSWIERTEKAQDELKNCVQPDFHHIKTQFIHLSIKALWFGFGLKKRKSQNVVVAPEFTKNEVLLKKFYRQKGSMNSSQLDMELAFHSYSLCFQCKNQTRKGTDFMLTILVVNINHP